MATIQPKEYKYTYSHTPSIETTFTMLQIVYSFY